MVIRKFRKEDAEKVSKLILYNLVHVSGKYYSEEDVKNYSKRFTAKKIIESEKTREIYVVEEDGTIVGTISFEDNHIITTFVEADKQKHGIGKKMAEFAEDVIRKNGFKNVELLSSLNAVAFYEKLGYKQIKEVWDDGVDILMRKEL